jgi:sugar lactone lactonase YvrE
VRRRLIIIVALAALVLSMPIGASAAPRAAEVAGAPAGAPSRPFVRLVRVIDTDRMGIERPAGLAWSPRAMSLVVVRGSVPQRTVAHLVSLFEVDGGELALTGGLVADSIAVDGASGRLVGLDATRRQVVRIGAERGRPAVAAGVTRSALGRVPGRAGGLAVDRAGATWVLDAAAHRIVRADGRATVNLAALGGTAIRGLAIHPVNGHFFVLATATRKLHELDGAGRLLSTRDLSAMGLRDPRALVLAPSGDPTDELGRVNAYIADAGIRTGATVAGAGIYELALAPTAQFAVAATGGSVVRTIDTSTWSPASPDPSGLSYKASTDQLVVVDGEVDELTGVGPAGNNRNGWHVSRMGVVANAFRMSTKQGNPGFTNEPVGTAYDNATGRYFVSDDQEKRVWIVLPGSDGVVGTGDDVRSSFATTGFGSVDPEGLGFGNGELYISDGISAEVFRINPGPNGVFNGGGDDVITQFDVGSLGQPDAEGIDFDPATGHLWVVSNISNSHLLEVTPTGVAVQSVDVPVAFNSPGGLAVAPATDGPGNHIYVSERGVDNNQVSSENDGRIYELSATGGQPPAPGEHLANAGFELDATGDTAPDSWVINSAFTRSSAVVHGGTFSARHASSANIAYDVYQNVGGIVGGNPYTFDGWLNIPATSDSFTFMIKLKWRSGSTNLLTETILTRKTATSGWIQVNAPRTAPAGANSVRVMMVVKSLNATIYVDDFSLFG